MVPGERRAREERWVDIHLQRAVSIKKVTEIKTVNQQATTRYCFHGYWDGVWICHWAWCSLYHYYLIQRWKPLCGLLLSQSTGCLLQKYLWSPAAIGVVLAPIPSSIPFKWHRRFSDFILILYSLCEKQNSIVSFQQTSHLLEQSITSASRGFRFAKRWWICTLKSCDPIKHCLNLEFRLEISSCFSNQRWSIYLLQIFKNFSSQLPWQLLLRYTAGICTEQEFGSRKLGKGLPATPTAGGAALQGNLQTQTTRLWSILKWGTTE